MKRILSLILALLIVFIPSIVSAEEISYTNSLTVNPKYLSSTGITVKCPYCGELNDVDSSGVIYTSEYTACAIQCCNPNCLLPTIVKLYNYNGICTQHNDMNRMSVVSSNADSHLLDCNYCNYQESQAHIYSTYGAGQGTDSICNKCNYDILAISITSPTSGTSYPTGTSITVSGSSSINFFRAAASVTDPSGTVHWLDEIYDNTSYSDSFTLIEPGTYTIKFFVRDIHEDLPDTRAKNTSITITAEGHICEYGPWVNYDGVQHKKVCTICGDTQYEDHSLSSQTSNVGTAGVCKQTVTTCSSCNYSSTIQDPIHVYTNNCDATCNDCGYSRVAPHSYGTAYWTNVSSASVCRKYQQVCTSCYNANVLETDTSHLYDNSCDAICNDCGFTRSVTHSYGPWQSENYMQHIRTCACGSFERGTHSLSSQTSSVGTAGVCKQTVTTCSVCPYSSTTQDTSHAYSNDCDSTCNDCSYTRSAPHTFSNSCDTTCNNCSYTRSISHSYGTASWTSVGTSSVCRKYRQFCIVCYYENILQTDTSHAYDNSCDATCNDCGYTRSVSHSYGSWTSNDYMQHKRTCSVCGSVQYGNHSLSSQTSNVGTAGVCKQTVTTCSSCNYSSTTQDTSHAYTNSCDASCNDCGYTRSVSHTYTNNCDASCNVCGYTRTPPHSYGTAYWTNVGSASVCRKYQQVCTGCYAVKVLSTTTSHTYTNSADKTCNVCGYTRP